MTVPVLSDHPGDGVDPSGSVRAPTMRETEPPPRPDPSSSTTAADEFCLPDLLRALAGSCCHLAGADLCVLTVTSPPALALDVSHIGGPDWIPRQATAATIDAEAGQGTSLVSPTAANWTTAPPESTGMSLFVEVPIRVGSAVIGRVGLAAQHDHTGFGAQDRDTATTVATIAGDAVRLVMMIQGPHHWDGPRDAANVLADAIITALYDVGVQLHALTRVDATTGTTASVHHTIGALSQAVRQLQSVMYGSHSADIATEDP